MPSRWGHLRAERVHIQGQGRLLHTRKNAMKGALAAPTLARTSGEKAPTSLVYEERQTLVGERHALCAASSTHSVLSRADSRAAG